ncbi:MAG: MCP four helix bundle domain-containing protein, partial [Deltaproteobacteria bacterium]|nr:MCP four helix bundle domain-containing protein [Deltaproteobacteria bacterium]
MNNLRIGTRLAIGFASIVVLIVCVALVSYFELKEMKAQTDSLANVNFVKAQLASDAQESMQKVYQSIANSVYAKDPAVLKKEKEIIEKQRTAYRDSFKKLEDLEQNTEGKAILEKIKKLTQAASSANSKALSLATEGRAEEAATVIQTESYATMTPLLDSFDELSQFQKKRVALRYEEAVSA